MGAQRSLGINIHERSKGGATARRGGRSLPQLSEEPWDARRPTGLPRSEGNGQAFAARLAQTPGWLPQEGRTCSTGADGRQLHLPGAERQALRRTGITLALQGEHGTRSTGPRAQAQPARWREASVPSRGVQRRLPFCSAFE